MGDTLPLDRDAIARRLAEAVAWCSAPRTWSPMPHECIVPPATTCRFAEHRSPELKRRLVTPFVEKSGEEHALATKGPAGDHGHSVLTSGAEKAAIVEDLLVRRAALVRQTLSQSRDLLRGGRLLAVLQDWSLAEGACQVESRCFFDVFDTPPWDTWVWYFPDSGDGRKPSSDCLLAWVPPSRLQDVEMGIPVSSTECVVWASDLRGPIAGILRDAGLA